MHISFIVYSAWCISYRYPSLIPRHITISSRQPCQKLESWWQRIILRRMCGCKQSWIGRTYNVFVTEQIESENISSSSQEFNKKKSCRKAVLMTISFSFSFSRSTANYQKIIFTRYLKTKIEFLTPTRQNFVKNPEAVNFNFKSGQNCLWKFNISK